jgi:hypothetical protein
VAVNIFSLYLDAVIVQLKHSDNVRVELEREKRRRTKETQLRSFLLLLSFSCRVFLRGNYGSDYTEKNSVRFVDESTET